MYVCMCVEGRAFGARPTGCKQYLLAEGQATGFLSGSLSRENINFMGRCNSSFSVTVTTVGWRPNW